VIVAVPADIPVATPVVTPIVATKGAVLVQVPELMRSFNVVVFPSQTVAAPVMGASGLTTILNVAIQPAGVVYEIRTVPPDIPDTVPLALSTVATAVLPLFHVPPGTPLPNTVVLPSQSDAAPPIGANGLTVTVVVV
jgi:hypothetical protein